MELILVLGSTGYVGCKLVSQLVAEGYSVRCLVRDAGKARGLLPPSVQLIEGDVLSGETLGTAFQGVAAVYYLVHSMKAGEKGFEERDRLAASNVVRAAEDAGVRRIIYLGGLGRREVVQSPHLRSRHEVGDILRSRAIPVTEFRAAVILGSGSASFEMMHHLVNRLPVMICPRWVTVNTQPIAVDDVIRYLVQALARQETAGKIFDIGGPEILSYRSMMLRLAAILQLRRWLIEVPVLTPRLSSYWVNFVTPIPAALARALIESLRHETVCENDDALRLFPFQPVSFDAAVQRALRPILPHATAGDDTTPHCFEEIDPSHVVVDRRTVDSNAKPEDLFATVLSIGGENGWFYANWLWWLRGLIDERLGGIGMRKGRRHPTELMVGDTIDFWRVLKYDARGYLCLRAEINVWGAAWLDFVVEPLAANRSRLILTARYYPKGLTGIVYWWIVYPLHQLIFRNMARAICGAASNQR